MKFRKIHLLYILTIIPSILIIGFDLGLIYLISLLNRLHVVATPGNRIIGESIALLFTQLFTISVKYLAVILIVSLAALIIRFFKTTAGWINLSVHIFLSVFLGGLLLATSFAIARLIGSLFGWSFY